MYLECGCTQVYGTESVETHTETTADTEECICGNTFLGDLSNHPQRGTGLRRHGALRSEVLHGTGSEGPQQEVHGSKNEVDEAMTLICRSTEPHARNMHTPEISSARTHFKEKVVLRQRILREEQKYTHIYIYMHIYVRQYISRYIWMGYRKKSLSERAQKHTRRQIHT